MLAAFQVFVAIADPGMGLFTIFHQGYFADFGIADSGFGNLNSAAVKVKVQLLLNPVASKSLFVGLVDFLYDLSWSSWLEPDACQFLPLKRAGRH